MQQTNREKRGSTRKGESFLLFPFSSLFKKWHLYYLSDERGSQGTQEQNQDGDEHIWNVGNQFQAAYFFSK